ncbi:MAG: hypothetical protein IKU34_09090 [Clostridia bacterium]|nr:hypothetical protein [Clostridia bacterium]
MIEPLSPYALLKQSKPKHPSVYTTAYDLYSAVAQEKHDHASDNAAAPLSPPHPLQSSIPTVRTHYITDIKKRHQNAVHAARQSLRTIT